VTVCDAAGWFDVRGDSSPRWINHTGGDSVWSAAATGSAVYVQGHFSHLNNRDGVVRDWRSGRRLRGPSRHRRHRPHKTGKALLPCEPEQAGSDRRQRLLATRAGLWVPSDSRRINGSVAGVWRSFASPDRGVVVL